MAQNEETQDSMNEEPGGFCKGVALFFLCVVTGGGFGAVFMLGIQLFSATGLGGRVDIAVEDGLKYGIVLGAILGLALALSGKKSVRKSVRDAPETEETITQEACNFRLNEFKALKSPAMGVCAKCTETTYMICPNCDKAGEFTLAETHAQCSCGQKIEQYSCPCGATVYRSSFSQDATLWNSKFIAPAELELAEQVQAQELENSIPTGLLVVTRPSCWGSSAINLGIVVNGREVGKLSNGKTLTVKVPAGDCSVLADPTFGSPTKPVLVTVTAERATTIRVDRAGFGDFALKVLSQEAAASQAAIEAVWQERGAKLMASMKTPIGHKVTLASIGLLAISATLMLAWYGLVSGGLVLFALGIVAYCICSKLKLCRACLFPQMQQAIPTGSADGVTSNAPAPSVAKLVRRFWSSEGDSKQEPELAAWMKSPIGRKASIGFVGLLLLSCTLMSGLGSSPTEEPAEGKELPWHELVLVPSVRDETPEGRKAFQAKLDRDIARLSFELRNPAPAPAPAPSQKSTIRPELLDRMMGTDVDINGRIQYGSGPAAKRAAAEKQGKE